MFLGFVGYCLLLLTLRSHSYIGSFKSKLPLILLIQRCHLLSNAFTKVLFLLNRDELTHGLDNDHHIPYGPTAVLGNFFASDEIAFHSVFLCDNGKATPLRPTFEPHLLP